jgi:hypothetical protein
MERVRQREWPARRDRHGDRYLQAALLESGDLVIEGQDLGDELPVPGTSGVTEYEFAWTIPADQIPRLVELLGGEPGDDVLDLLVGRLPTSRAASSPPSCKPTASRPGSGAASRRSSLTRMRSWTPPCSKDGRPGPPYGSADGTVHAVASRRLAERPGLDEVDT